MKKLQHVTWCHDRMSFTNQPRFLLCRKPKLLIPPTVHSWCDRSTTSPSKHFVLILPKKRWFDSSDLPVLFQSSLVAVAAALQIRKLFIQWCQVRPTYHAMFRPLKVRMMNPVLSFGTKTQIHNQSTVLIIDILHQSIGHRYVKGQIFSKSDKIWYTINKAKRL